MNTFAKVLLFFAIAIWASVACVFVLEILHCDFTEALPGGPPNPAEYFIVRLHYFINLACGGWFVFMLSRFIALGLVILLVRCIWQSFPRVGACLAALLVLNLGVFAVMKSYSPAGTYGGIDQFERFESGEDQFFRISGGQIEEFYGNRHSLYGQYGKTSDGWLVRTGTEEPTLRWRLKFCVFGFWMVNVENGGTTAFFPRRIIPIVRPSWMPDWLQ